MDLRAIVIDRKLTRNIAINQHNSFVRTLQHAKRLSPVRIGYIINCILDMNNYNLDDIRYDPGIPDTFVDLLNTCSDLSFFAPVSLRSVRRVRSSAPVSHSPKAAAMKPPAVELRSHQGRLGRAWGDGA